MLFLKWLCVAATASVQQSPAWACLWAAGVFAPSPRLPDTAQWETALPVFILSHPEWLLQREGAQGLKEAGGEGEEREKAGEHGPLP